MTDRLVNPGQLASKVVKRWHLADNVVAAANIIDGTITAAKIANRTRNLFITLGGATIQAGTPALAVQGANFRYRAWAFDAASTEALEAEFLVPSDWASGNITINYWWTNVGAGTGNVVWALVTKSFAAAADLDNTTSQTVVSSTIAAPAQNILKISTMTSTLAGVAGTIYTMTLQRTGGDAADTLANDAGLICVEIQYTADS